MDVPDTEFASAGKTRIAYQLFGSGPLELVLCGGPAGHVDIYWEEWRVRRVYEWLASYARVAVFDRRGTGASDPGEGPPSDEQYMDDLMAVIDAAGFERPALLGVSEAGRVSILCAATHPERISALVLHDVAAAGSAALDEGMVDALKKLIHERWGKGDVVNLYAPSAADDARFRRWCARLERNAVSPSGALQILELARSSNVEHALQQVRCRTLVLHRRDNALVPIAAGRAVAEGIPHARFVEVNGQDTMSWVGDMDTLFGEIERFLTGRRQRRRRDRTLAAVLFTDICDSTELAERVGSERWRELLGEHYRRLEEAIADWDGEVIKWIGDGLLATFHSPGFALDAARDAVDACQSLGLGLRAGLHVGEVDVLEGDVAGVAVHVAARVMEQARSGEVLVSRTVCDALLGSGRDFRDRGTHRLRGVSGEWQLFNHGRRADISDMGERAPETIASLRG